MLRAANGLEEDVDLSLTELESRRYYETCFLEDSHAAWLVFDGEEVVGTGAVSFYQVMPTYHNPSGKKAYIMNMYTRPDYRRRGIAYRVLELLTAEAEMRQIDAVTLEATAAGRPLYEAFGFTAMRAEMELLGGNKFRDTGKEKIILKLSMSDTTAVQVTSWRAERKAGRFMRRWNRKRENGFLIRASTVRSWRLIWRSI